MLLLMVTTTSCDGGAGVEEHCKEYLYVEQRQGWEAEQRRLKKELEKHSQQATKVRKAASSRVPLPRQLLAVCHAHPGCACC